jgi:hypothetical protein
MLHEVAIASRQAGVPGAREMVVGLGRIAEPFHLAEQRPPSYRLASIRDQRITPMQYCRVISGIRMGTYDATGGAKYIILINILYKRYIYKF